MRRHRGGGEAHGKTLPGGAAIYLRDVVPRYAALDSRRKVGANHANQRVLASQQQLAASRGGSERQKAGTIDQLADVQGIFAGTAGGTWLASHRFREPGVWRLSGIRGGKRGDRLLEGRPGDLRQRAGDVSLPWRAIFIVFLDDDQRPGRGTVARVWNRRKRGD